MMKVRGDAGKGQQKTAGLFPAPPFDRQQHRGAPGIPKAQAFFRLQALPSAARHGVSTAISACTKIPRHKIAGIAKACKSCAENCFHKENLLFRGSPDGSRLKSFLSYRSFFGLSTGNFRGKRIFAGKFRFLAKTNLITGSFRQPFSTRREDSF